MADDITARSLTLVDAAGRPRIIMDAGGEDGCAKFSVVSVTGERIVIDAQPNGTVALSVDQYPRLGRIMITRLGFDLRTQDGKFAVTVGDFFNEGVDRLTVYRDGQPVWEMPQDNATPQA
jgi:hypothetical protein